MVPASWRAASLLPLLLSAAVDAQNTSGGARNSTDGEDHWSHNSSTDPANNSTQMHPPADAPCADPLWVPAGGIAPEEFMWLAAEADAWEGPLPAGLEAPTAGWYCAHPNPCADVYIAEATCDIREVLALAGDIMTDRVNAPATDDPRLAVYCACRDVMAASDARPVAAASCAGSGHDEDEDRHDGSDFESWAAVLMTNSSGSIVCPSGAVFGGNRTLDYHCTDEGEIDNETECNRAAAEDGCVDGWGNPCHWELRTCDTFVGYFLGIWTEGEASAWWSALGGIVETLDRCCEP